MNEIIELRDASKNYVEGSISENANELKKKIKKAHPEVIGLSMLRMSNMLKKGCSKILRTISDADTQLSTTIPVAVTRAKMLNNKHKKKALEDFMYCSFLQDRLGDSGSVHGSDLSDASNLPLFQKDNSQASRSGMKSLDSHDRPLDPDSASQGRRNADIINNMLSNAGPGLDFDNYDMMAMADPSINITFWDDEKPAFNNLSFDMSSTQLENKIASSFQQKSHKPAVKKLKVTVDQCLEKAFTDRLPHLRKEFEFVEAESTYSIGLGLIKKKADRLAKKIDDLRKKGRYNFINQQKSELEIQGNTQDFDYLGEETRQELNEFGRNIDSGQYEFTQGFEEEIIDIEKDEMVQQQEQAAEEVAEAISSYILKNKNRNTDFNDLFKVVSSSCKMDPAFLFYQLMLKASGNSLISLSQKFAAPMSKEGLPIIKIKIN